MPRYIDADRFSERFDMMCDAGGVLAPVTEAIRKMVKKLINAEPTADVEPVKHWICVKERLPENDGLYIVCKTVRGYRISFEARWSCKHWLSVVKDMQLEYITHWMPLPEPPKGECDWVDDDSLPNEDMIPDNELICGR